MKKFFITLAVICSWMTAFGWGQKGHDVVAFIAEQHLTPATRAAVDSILDGRSMVYWANWLDNASHTPEYAYTKTWHYKNVNADETYLTALANPSGDAVTAIKAQLELLNSGEASKQQALLAMKILVHVVGDLHMPLHMGHASDLGGNRIKVKFFGRDKNLHSVWDTDLVESAHKWSHSEWQYQLDRLAPAAQQKVVEGNVDDWAQETIRIADVVYKSTPEGTNLSYNEVAKWAPVIEKQLLSGGLRLAHLLNQTFDPAYGK
ncbi:MAG: S1/P1 nuclease [Muribaculaceae bacterium]|nr:S1/P1 nuclease [Muribaculaceae bacterium]